jgi:hypothetical protein
MSLCTRKEKKMSKVREWLESLAKLLVPKAEVVETSSVGDGKSGIVTLALVQGEARVELAVSYDRKNYRVGFSVKKAENGKVLSGSISFQNDRYEVSIEGILEMKFKSASMIPWGVIGQEVEKAING